MTALSRLRRYLSGSGLGPVLVKAVTGSAGLRIAGMGFGFLVGVQLARGLGAEGYGIYGVAMSIIALLTVPTEFGLPHLLTRELAAAQVRKDWGRMSGILRWSTRVSMLIAAVIAVAVVSWLLLSGGGLDSPLGMTLLAGVAMVPVVSLVALRSASLRGLQHIVKGQVPDTVLRPALHSLLLFVTPLVFLSLTPPLAMALGAVSAVLSLAVATWLLRQIMPPKVTFVPPIIESGTWWSGAWPMALSDGMRMLQANVGILLLSGISTMAAVGVYRVASSTVLLVALPATMLNMVAAPIISRLHAAGDYKKLQRLLTWLAMCMVMGSALMTLPFLIAGERVIGSVFGVEFASANLVLIILCVGVIVNSMFGVGAALLNMTGYQERVTRASLISLVMLALISPPSIIAFDTVGAAASSVLSFSAWNIIVWRDAARLLSVDSSIFIFLRKSGI